MTDLMRMGRDGPIGILQFLLSAIPIVSIVDALIRKLDEAERDSTIRAVVMTGGENFQPAAIWSAFVPRSARAPAPRTNWWIAPRRRGARPTDSASRSSRAVDGVAFQRAKASTASPRLLTASRNMSTCPRRNAR